MGVLSNKFDIGLRAIQNNTPAPYWTIEAGKPLQRVNDAVQIRPGSRQVGYGAGQLGFQYLIDVAMAIDEFSYAATTYANIARQRLFRLLYQVQDRTVAYIVGTTAGTKLEESFPCQDCGLVLPTSLMSIDHSRPQSGGETEAVAKVLRTLGLTVAGSSSPKATQLNAGVAAALQSNQGFANALTSFSMNGTVQPVPTKPGRGPKGPATSTRDDRYSLKWEGGVFYSVAIALDCVSELQTRCMHSLINLRPLCSGCNSSRGNPLKFANPVWWQ
jgi:hypothetical protein